MIEKYRELLDDAKINGIRPGNESKLMEAYIDIFGVDKKVTDFRICYCNSIVRDFYKCLRNELDRYDNESKDTTK